MATEIINAFNIFIDSERCLNASSDGDSIALTLNQHPITCDDNQFIRLSLQNFSAYKSFTNININNNTFRITHNDSTNPQTDKALYIPPANYSSLNDIATAFANSLGTQLGTDLGLTYTIPNATLFPPQSGTSDNIIAFTLKFSGNHGLTQLLIRTLIDDGDIFEVLGTNRIKEDNGLASWHLLESCNVNLSVADEITVQCYYNAQLSSQQNVYLKTDVNSTSIQTESFASGNADNANGSKMSASNILGRMIVDTDFINFNTSSSDEYSINLSTKMINHMRLFITDSHGRKIPPNVKYINNIAVYPTDQLKLGNRSFEAVIKVEIMQYTGARNNQLITEKTRHTIPARFESFSPYSLNTKLKM
jgi:hypothetical protein